MPSRRLPQTDDNRSKALKTCSDKFFATADPTKHLITPAQNNTLQSLLSPWRNARNTAAHALQEQGDSTTTCDGCQHHTARIISHFIQVLNFAIERGTLTPGVRAHYKLPISHPEVPTMNTVQDTLLWADNINDGELARVNQGGPPLAWPSATEVAAQAALLSAAEAAQSTAKDFYDQLQQSIATQRPGIDAHIRDLWDTIEYNLRHEPTPASLRRKAREWGVVYINDDGTEETDEPAQPTPAQPTP